VIEEPPVPQRAAVDMRRPLQIVALSARREQALRELAARYAERLTRVDDTAAADVAYTANAGRTHFPVRAAVVGRNAAELAQGLRACAEARAVDGVRVGEVDGGVSADVVFLFTGLGSQHNQMGRELYDTQPVFRSAIDTCAELLVPHLDQPLLSILYPAAGVPSLLEQTAYAQPAVFALEYALTELWKSWGVTPAAVMGHSLGEDVAGCVAGVLELGDALALMAARGRMMQALPANGEMRVVFASEESVHAVLAQSSGGVSIAAVNGPRSVTISGEAEGLRRIVDAFAAQGIKSKTVTASHAFHSPLMDPVLEPLEHVASRITYSEPRIDFVSNVTGELVTTGEISRPDYWRRHVRDTVQFARGAQTLFDRGYRIFVEIGPSTTLSSLARQGLPAEAVCLSSLKRGCGDWDHLLETLSELYLRGVAIDWEGFDAAYDRQRAEAPLYPFQRKRYWVEALETNSPEPVAAAPVPTPAVAAVESSWLDEWHAAYPDERHRRLVDCVREEVARVLKVDVEELRDPYAGLMDLGLDSLMAVELRTALTERLRLARPLSATLVMDHPSMDAIAKHLESELLSLVQTAATTVVVTPTRVDAVAVDVSQTVESLEPDIESLSEDEVEALLLRKLDAMQEPV
jgi:acyl transferase domain-containing protein